MADEGDLLAERDDAPEGKGAFESPERERADEIERLAVELLGALQPWQMQSADVRAACVKLTVRCAALAAADTPEGMYVAERMPPFHRWLRQEDDPLRLAAGPSVTAEVLASIDEALAAMGFVRAAGTPEEPPDFSGAGPFHAVMDAAPTHETED